MSADGGGSRFLYPTGKTVEHLYQTLRVLIDTLNREQKSDEVDLTALQEAIEAAQNTLNEIELNGALTPQQEFELSLVTAVDTMLGSVSSMVLDTIKRSQDAAAATIRALLEGRKNKVAIRVEQKARLTEQEAFVSQLTTFEAQLLNALASITQETTARTNADNALAQVDQTITTALNGNIAQVQILAQSVDGIEQKFAVTLNQNGQVTGLVQLDGTAAGSTFTVVADKFQIAQPDQTGGTPKTVYSIGNVNGVPTLVFAGDMYGDGTITAQKLNVASIATLRISDPANTYYWDFANGREGSTDGKATIDIKNRRILFLGT